MRIEQLKKAHQARPFMPFTIRMADGRSFEVPHPEFLTHSVRTIAVSDPADQTISILDLLLVTELQFQDTDAASA